MQPSQQTALQSMRQARDMIKDFDHWYRGPGMARDRNNNPVVPDALLAYKWNVPGAVAVVARRTFGLGINDTIIYERRLFKYIFEAASEHLLRLDDLEDDTKLTEREAHQRDLRIMDRACELAELDLQAEMKSQTSSSRLSRRPWR